MFGLIATVAITALLLLTVRNVWHTAQQPTPTEPVQCDAVVYPDAPPTGHDCWIVSVTPLPEFAAVGMEGLLAECGLVLQDEPPPEPAWRMSPIPVEVYRDADDFPDAPPDDVIKLN